MPALITYFSENNVSLAIEQKLKAERAMKRAIFQLARCVVQPSVPHCERPKTLRI